MTRTHSRTRQELQVSDTDWCLHVRMQKGIVCIHSLYELVYCNDVRDHMDFVYICAGSRSKRILILVTYYFFFCKQ